MAARSPAHTAFGEAIRQRRGELGLSQEALAEACDLDRTYISGIERGTRNPSLTNILKIAGALQLRPADLLTQADQRHESVQYEARCRNNDLRTD